MSQSCCARLFLVRVWFSKIQAFNFLACLFFFQFFMNLLVKINMKRHDRHNTTLWTTDFFNSVFFLVPCSSKNQVPYFILKKVVTDSNLTRLLLNGKKKISLRAILKIHHRKMADILKYELLLQQRDVTYNDTLYTARLL